MLMPNATRPVALITVDVQNDFVVPGAPLAIAGTYQLIPQMVELVSAFRRAQQPVIHLVRLYLSDGSNAEACRRDMIRDGTPIVRPGTAGAELVAALQPSPAVQLHADQLLHGQVQTIGHEECLIYKPRWGAFYHTPLEQVLRKKDIHSLVFCGCNFPNCPRASIYEASERDFDIIVVTDAVSALDAHGVSELERIGVCLQDAAATIAWQVSRRVLTGLPAPRMRKT